MQSSETPGGVPTKCGRLSGSRLVLVKSSGVSDINPLKNAVAAVVGIFQLHQMGSKASHGCRVHPCDVAACRIPQQAAILDRGIVGAG
jgi:hypothetical protein